jgi:hypothetical protein
MFEKGDRISLPDGIIPSDGLLVKPLIIEDGGKKKYMEFSPFGDILRTVDLGKSDSWIPKLFTVEISGLAEPYVARNRFLVYKKSDFKQYSAHSILFDFTRAFFRIVYRGDEVDISPHREPGDRIVLFDAITGEEFTEHGSTVIELQHSEHSRISPIVVWQPSAKRVSLYEVFSSERYLSFETEDVPNPTPFIKAVQRCKFKTRELFWASGTKITERMVTAIEQLPIDKEYPDYIRTPNVTYLNGEEFVETTPDQASKMDVIREDRVSNGPRSGLYLRTIDGQRYYIPDRRSRF